jgi:S1 RNA binding domain protein
MEVVAGTIVEGKVTGITNFGAFVSLPEGRTGLVHISEVADGYVRDVRDHLREDQVVRVMILAVDPAGKISLSVRRAAPAQAPRNSAGFEDKLKRFIKESTEKQNDLKRNFETKRGR